MSDQLRLTVAAQDVLLAWAAPRCSLDGDWPDGSEAMAVIDGTTIKAVVVMNNRIGEGSMMHIASDGSHSWANRRILGGIFGYVFIFKGLHAVTAIVNVYNVPALVMALKLGFQFEGRKRSIYGPQDDDIILGMIRPECHWIKDAEHGQT